MESEGKNGKTQIIDITYQNISDRVKRKIDFSPITLVEINVDSKEYKERTLHKIFAKFKYWWNSIVKSGTEKWNLWL